MLRSNVERQFERLNGQRGQLCCGCSSWSLIFRAVAQNFAQNLRERLPVEESLFLRHGPWLQPAQVAHRLGWSRQPARTKIAGISVAAQPIPEKISEPTRLLRWPAPKRAKILWPLR